MPDHFDKLIAEIREREAAPQRRHFEDAGLVLKSIIDGGKRHRRRMAELNAMAGQMLKARRADLAAMTANNRETNRANARANLARINAKATELAACGKLTGEQGAILDDLIHRAAERIGRL
jgi:hypothetical protein